MTQAISQDHRQENYSRHENYQHQNSKARNYGELLSEILQLLIFLLRDPHPSFLREKRYFARPKPYHELANLPAQIVMTSDLVLQED